jgi:hypothetical protein
VGVATCCRWLVLSIILALVRLLSLFLVVLLAALLVIFLGCSILLRRIDLLGCRVRLGQVDLLGRSSLLGCSALLGCITLVVTFRCCMDVLSIILGLVRLLSLFLIVLLLVVLLLVILLARTFLAAFRRGYACCANAFCCPINGGGLASRPSTLRNYDAIPEACSRSERGKAKVFGGATSAFGTGRELDAELIRTDGSRILRDMSEYECKEYDGRHVQDYRS